METVYLIIDPSDATIVGDKVYKSWHTAREAYIKFLESKMSNPAETWEELAEISGYGEDVTTFMRDLYIYGDWEEYFEDTARFLECEVEKN